MVDPQKKGFEDFYLSDEMLRALADVGYVTPTPVQTATIPLGMAGIDLIVQSQTGTGKTAAFGIPILEMVVDPKPGRIDALVLAPTRELAKQVAEEFERLGAHKKIKVATIYGGASYEKQYEELAVSNIVCATPGRLLDILNRGNLSLKNLRILCLDEADEMLSMGFAEDLNAILKYLPEERQSLLFSATVTEEIKSLANNMLYYPEFVTLSGGSVAAADVEHHYIPVRGVGRTRDVLALLQYEQPENAIIFANTKDDTFTLSRYLKRHGLRADVLNGDLPQKERERTLAALRDNKIDFLVATDVAARGIDISDLSHVINYTLPDSAEVYIHRTGRTGRAGKKGKAISLVSPREMGTLFNIKKLYKFSMNQRSLPTAKEILEARQKTRVNDLISKIDQMSQLPYGAHLGVAEALVGAEDADRLRFVAKLLAVADTVAKNTGKVVAVPVESKPAETPVFETDTVETVSEPVQADSDVSPAECLEAPADDDVPIEQGRRRRRRRHRGESTTDETLEMVSHQGRAPREERAARSQMVSRDERDPKPREERDPKPREERDPKPPVERDPKPREERKDARSPSDRDRSGRGRNRRSDRNERDSQPTMIPLPARTWSKMWINVGKNRVERSDDVIEIVCYLAGMEPDDFGQVSLESTFSYLDVREDYFYDILQAVNQQEYDGMTIAAEAARK